MIFVHIFLFSMAAQGAYKVPVDAKEKCKVQNTRGPDQYEFVRVTESVQQIVLQVHRVGRAGESSLLVQDKLEHKWPVDLDYPSPLSRIITKHFPLLTPDHTRRSFLRLVATAQTVGFLG